MMHLKNITAGNPKTKEQYQLTKQFNIKWLYTEDGKNWYEVLASKKASVILHKNANRTFAKVEKLCKFWRTPP